MTVVAHRTALAFFSPVNVEGLFKLRGGLIRFSADHFHRQSGRADILIILLVVRKILRSIWALIVLFLLLLLVEGVVLHISDHFFLFQIFIILFGTISCI